MIKSLLIGLDGSEDSRSALELGLRWAQRFDALVVGLGIAEEPGLFNPGESLLGDGDTHDWRTTPPAILLHGARRQVDEILEAFVRCCGEAGVECRTLEGVGSPFVRIIGEAQRYDLIVLGRRTHFGFGSQVAPDVTLSKVLADSPRPVVAVPENPGDGKSVLVAYDGSLQAARALSSLDASGLGRGREIRVVSIAEGRKDAARRADRAVEFLKAHGHDAIPYPVESGHPAAEVLLETIRLCEPGLLVMGAYGRPVLREFFLGSTTRTMLERCPVPMFLDH